MTQTLKSEVIARLEINCTHEEHYELVIKKAKGISVVYLTEAEAKEISEKFDVIIQND